MNNDENKSKDVIEEKLEVNEETKKEVSFTDTTKLKGKLIGILTMDGLLFIRGNHLHRAMCCKFNAVGNIPDGSTNGFKVLPIDKPCTGACPMFGEPIYNEELDYTELQICDGRKLQFKKLFDFRGQILGINLLKASDKEVNDFFKSKNILSDQE